MKNQFAQKIFAAAVGIAALMVSVLPMVAQDAAVRVGSSSVSQPAPSLTLGVPDVLKLSNAKVSEDTIVAYISSSSSSYGGLGATEIVYLHDQGVSDRVVTAMLTKARRASETAAQAAAAQPVAGSGGTTTWQTAQTAVAPQAAPTSVTYVQSPPASTVYYMPDSRLDYGYYPNYGYYGYGYGYPALSLSFGFGSGYCGNYYGGYYGGYRGGYCGTGSSYYGGAGYSSGGYRGGGGSPPPGGSRGGVAPTSRGGGGGAAPVPRSGGGSGGGAPVSRGGGGAPRR